MSSDAFPKSWVAINTHPHKEHLALMNLQRQSFAVYCPMLQRRVRHARRERLVLRPMFPGYVFAAVERSLALWRPMLSTFGVRSVVRSGDQLSFLPRGLVEALQEREIDGAIVKPVSPYKVGQVVRIAQGPFDGLIATIVEMDDRDRLVVLMDLLNRPVKVKIEATGVAELPGHGA
ncbi:MAG: transcription termination/antitermination NusG family protein [Hyphomicrobiaceae bacterium]|nr:transcription termination/antitermination NusG family protein [Hyphomicrobiaceae bacterium]